MTWIAQALLMICLAVPPLTEPQRMQLETAQDSEAFDTAALYPLLDNALTWTPGDEAGAMIPDPKAILESPEKFRGQLFLLEGDYAGRARTEGDTLPRLARPGAWSKKLQEWVLVTDRKRDEVVVVYLVAPPAAPPRAGSPVRVVGRFYKVWHSTDLANNPQAYLTFVGHTATFTPAGGIGSGSSVPVLPIVGAIVLLGVVFLFIRARKVSMQVKPLGTRIRREARKRAEEAGEVPFPDEADPSLPKDPTEALAELERRRAQERGVQQ